MAQQSKLTLINGGSYGVGTLIALLLASLHSAADAGVITSEATLNVFVTTSRFGGIQFGESAEAVVPVGATRSIQVDSVGATTLNPPIATRFAAAVGTATVNNLSSGTVRLDGSFAKLPLVTSGGLTGTSAGLVYRFETDSTATLLVETANLIQATTLFGVRSPRWEFNGTPVGLSDLDSNASWSIAIDPGIHELELFGTWQSTAWGQGSNESGQFSTVFNWGIDSLPGTLSNPILPTEINPGDFGFDIVTTNDIRFYDPVIATGYDYVASNIPFASVLIPDVLPGGDSQFQSLVGSDTFALGAGDAFDFTAINPNGVLEFGIRGIDPAEQLDPDDPTAFITGLSSVQGGAASRFRMTATTTSISNVVPEPSSAMAWSLLIGMGVMQKRRRRVRFS